MDWESKTSSLVPCGHNRRMPRRGGGRFPGSTMKFTLNTLGAPSWDLEQTARNARAYGYSGVDLRLLDGEVISLESVRANRDRLRALFPAAELPVAVLAPTKSV